jgi:peptidyl-prolyl cis-trans isomerase D
MLASIRKFAKSWFAAVLIGLLIVSFAVFGIRDVFKGHASDAVVTAGSRTVTTADFKREFDTFRKGAEQQVGQPITPEIAAANGLDKRVMDEVATREAFGEMLSKIGVRPSDTLIKAELQKIPAFFDQVSGRFDRKLYEQRLGENGLNPVKFEGIMRDEIAQSHAISAMVDGLRVPRAYSAMGAIYGMEQRDVGFFTLAPNSVPQPELPTDAQLTKLMQDNAAQLMRPEFRVLTVVRFSPSLVAANLPIDEAELKKRYDFRKDTLSKPETRSLVQIPVKDAASAQAVAARLGKGEDAAAIAKSLGVDAIAYADKPRTAIADPKVGEAAFAMPVGAVSAIKGDLGLAVVKVTKSSPGHAVTLEELRPQLEAELRKDAAAEKVYALSQAYDDAHAGGANLAESAKKAGVPVVTVGPVSSQGGDPQGQPVQGVAPKLLETAFALPTGGESEVEDAGNGEYYAVRVEKIIPKALPALADVKPQLTRVWMVRELVKRLQAKADELAARLNKGETLEAVAASAGSSVTRATSIDRQNAAENKALSRDALIKAFGAKQGEVFTAEGTQLGLVVAKLEAIRAPTGPTLARITEDSRPQMTMTIFREIGENARKAARDAVKVKLYPNQARVALGLEPLEPAKADAKTDAKAGKAGKTELAK